MVCAAMISAIVAITVVRDCASFPTSLPLRRRATAALRGAPSFLSSSSSNDNDDFPSDFPPPDEENYEGEVDWDEEWKKVVSNQDQPKKRPMGNYKSDVEIAATKVKRSAEAKLDEVRQSASFDFRSVRGDWKFWIGVLAVISVGSSLIAGAGQVPYTDDSFYI